MFRAYLELRQLCERGDSPARWYLRAWCLRRAEERSGELRRLRIPGRKADPFDLASLVTGINALIREAMEPYQHTVDAVHSSAITNCTEDLTVVEDRRRSTLTRIAFEEDLGPDILRSAPALEFADRKYSVPEFIDAVPENFDGVIDLSACNAVLSGEALRRKRHHCLARLGKYVSRMEHALDPYVDVFTYLRDVNARGYHCSYIEAIEAVSHGYLPTSVVRRRRYISNSMS